MSFPFAGAFLQLPMLDLLLGASLISKVVLVLLIIASVMSWTVIFAKWKQLKAAGLENAAFLRAFRKAPRLEAIAALAEQFQTLAHGTQADVMNVAVTVSEMPVTIALRHELLDFSAYDVIMWVSE